MQWIMQEHTPCTVNDYGVEKYVTGSKDADGVIHPIYSFSKAPTFR